jgi:2-hydroxychromene-2-carboxylate isomerase
LRLFYDLGSPYAYLAVERAERVLGTAPVLEPILLGAIFARRGHGSWAHTDERERNIGDVERRAAEYGLPPVTWPPGWPPNTLAAMRAATWAPDEAFARAAFRAAFARGEDLADVDVLARIAEEVGLPGEELRAGIARDDVKQRLKDATERAWELGVRGVPTLVDGKRVLYGDDRMA